MNKIIKAILYTFSFSFLVYLYTYAESYYSCGYLVTIFIGICLFKLSPSIWSKALLLIIIIGQLSATYYNNTLLMIILFLLLCFLPFQQSFLPFHKIVHKENMKDNKTNNASQGEVHANFIHKEKVRFDLRNILEFHNPKLIASIDIMLDEYNGKEDELLTKMKQEYNIDNEENDINLDHNIGTSNVNNTISNSENDHFNIHSVNTDNTNDYSPHKYRATAIQQARLDVQNAVQLRVQRRIQQLRDKAK